MKCFVCQASYDEAKGPRCSNCGYDASQPGAEEPGAILKARDVFRTRTTIYDPESRVTTFDKWKPWLGLLLGFVIFIFWLRACSSMGWRLF